MLASVEQRMFLRWMNTSKFVIRQVQLVGRKRPLFHVDSHSSCETRAVRTVARTMSTKQGIAQSALNESALPMRKTSRNSPETQVRMLVEVVKASRASCEGVNLNSLNVLLHLLLQHHREILKARPLRNMVQDIVSDVFSDFERRKMIADDEEVVKMVGNLIRLRDSNLFSKAEISKWDLSGLLENASPAKLQHQSIRILLWSHTKLFQSPTRKNWDQLENRAMEIMNDFSFGELSVVIWSMARFQYYPKDEFFRKFQIAVVNTLNSPSTNDKSISAQQLVNTMWSIAKLRLQPSVDLLKALECKADELKNRFNHIDCANMAWAVTKFQHSFPSTRLLSLLEHLLLEKIDQFPATELSKTFSGLVKTQGISDEGTISCVQNSFHEILANNRMDTESLVNLMWCFGKLQAPLSSHTFELVEERLLERSEQLTARDVSTVLWTMEKVGYMCPPTCWKSLENCVIQTLKGAEFRTFITLARTLKQSNQSISSALGNEFVRCCSHASVENGLWSTDNFWLPVAQLVLDPNGASPQAQSEFIYILSANISSFASPLTPLVLMSVLAAAKLSAGPILMAQLQSSILQFAHQFTASDLAQALQNYSVLRELEVVQPDQDYLFLNSISSELLPHIDRLTSEELSQVRICAQTVGLSKLDEKLVQKIW